ncbi:MAG: ABC transporter substrate-binding protein [Sulfurospirillum cavolei]|nr:ABC transporter substrate-binding protein [Sulfurospirillum cavolei]
MRVFPRICLALMLLSSFLFADLLETVLQTKQLRVCIWPEYYGISYLNPRTQKLSGIDVDLAQEFASTLGVNVRFVQSSFATLIQDVSTHRCDIAMFAIGITPERQNYLRFTSPHLQSDIYAIVSKSNNRIQTWEDIDQKGVVVTVAKGTYHVELMQNVLRKASLHVVDSLREREREVESGRADVMMSDYPFSTQLLAEKEWAKRIAPTSSFHQTSYAWALDKNEEALYAHAEAFMQTIKHDGRLQTIAKRYALDPIVVLTSP